MKKINTVTFLLFLIFFAAKAQKLPTEQQVSLRAPADIKIDGNATDWNNTFQAYNKHVDFYYTMANDNDRLYLIIQATDPAIIRKITAGAITLTINKDGKNTKDGTVGITYPLFDKNNRFSASFTNKYAIGSSTANLPSDSLINLNNTRLTARVKTIKVTGVKGLDTLISVYNTDGIKAAALFDNKMAYTYELSVLLKHLGLSVNGANKFFYQLKINAVEQRGITITTIDGTAPYADMDPSKIKSIDVVGPNSQMGQPATDFWGEYTLAKK